MHHQHVIDVTVYILYTQVYFSYDVILCILSECKSSLKWKFLFFFFSYKNLKIFIESFQNDTWDTCYVLRAKSYHHTCWDREQAHTEEKTIVMMYWCIEDRSEIKVRDWINDQIWARFEYLSIDCLKFA